MSNIKQEAHGPRFSHLSKSAIACLQMPCNILQVLPQQLGQTFEVKDHPRIIICINLRLVSTMLHYKFHPQSFLGARQEDF